MAKRKAEWELKEDRARMTKRSRANFIELFKKKEKGQKRLAKCTRLGAICFGLVVLSLLVNRIPRSPKSGPRQSQMKLLMMKRSSVIED